jgi:hypothetical protein
VWTADPSREPVVAATVNNGCGIAPYVLCQQRDELFALLEQVVTAAAPVGCPAELLRRETWPEQSFPPAECVAVE